MTDPYKILGLERGATEETINKAYKKLAMKYHPDRNPGDKTAEEKFKEINAARDAIKNGETNPGAAHPGFNQGGPHAWHFNFGGGGAENLHFNNLDEILQAMHAQAQRRNRDVSVECQISLEDAFYGTEFSVSIRQQNDSRQVNVKIPAGVDNGNRIRMPQAGEHTFPSMPPGDLFVVVHVKPHPSFTRAGKNLLIAADIDIFDILIGGSGSLRGIDGTSLEVKIPPNFNPANQLRLIGQGMPAPHSTGRGDLLITVRPRYPTLSTEQIDLIKQARALSTTQEKAVDGLL